jgi:5S rRNA maturation endonuclease (ribonuclease M5)
MTTDADSDTAFAEFLELWKKLLADCLVPGTVVVVEGDRDRRALRGLGVLGPIVAIHAGRTLSGTAARLASGNRRVILLTDWDTAGGRLARRMKEFLAAGPVALDLDYRRNLARTLRGELAHVEGLSSWARRNAERRHASLDILLDLGDAPGTSAVTG